MATDLVLVGPEAGNDKDRPMLKVLNHLHNPYLERVAAIGVQPEAVDYILLTLTAGDEENLANVRTEARVGMPFRVPVPGVFVDSMMPLHAAGRVRRVRVDGREVLKGIVFFLLQVTALINAAISITSQVTKAIFGGDVMRL